MTRTFTAEVESPKSREEVKREILTRLSVPLGRGDYRIESESDSGVTYARTYRPYAVFSLSRANGKTHLVVVGDGPRALRSWFAELERWE